MDKRLMTSSNSSDRLWYAYREDTEWAELIGPDYLGTAGWHPDTEAGRAAAETRARLRYYWVPQDDLRVSRDRPADLPDDDPAHIMDGWVNPLGVAPGHREEVCTRNRELAAEYRRTNPNSNRSTDTKKD